MATILPTFLALGGNALRVTWAGMAGGDTGAPFACNLQRAKTAMIRGTIVGAVTIEGNNGGGAFLTLTDPQGTPISYAVAATEEVLEGVAVIRPAVAAGGGASVTVDLIVRP